MKFEESGNVITIKNSDKCFIYFLIDKGEVVYVGQTTNGLSRPFAHYDKEYDTVKAIPCHREMLDQEEDHYICKYSPKYNKCRNYNVVYSLPRVKRMVRNDYNLPKFNLVALKKIIKALGITPFVDEYTSGACITDEDLYKVLKYIERKLGYEQ